MGFIKTQKSRYLKNKTSFLQIKKSINLRMWDLVFIGISATFFILFVSTFILLLNNLLPLHLYSKFHCILCNFFYSNVFSYYFFVSKVLTPICLTSYAFQQILPFNKSFESHISHLSTSPSTNHALTETIQQIMP